MAIQKNYITILFSALLSTFAWGAANDDVEVSPTVLYQAVDVLTSYLNDDIAEISKITKKVAVVKYDQSEGLPESLRNYILKRVEKISQDNKATPVKFVQCLKCLKLRAVAEGDEIFIKKGITDEKELAEVLKTLNVRKYADINVTFAGRNLVLHASIKDKNGISEWVKEYKTPVGSFNDSQWVIGAAFQSPSFVGNAAMPSPKTVMVYAGQRLFGIGSVGLLFRQYGKTNSLSAISTYGGFFELSHNEFFNSYWDFMELSYLAEIGMTDFNAKQQITEAFGVKAKFSQTFTLRLAAHMHHFATTPKDDSEILNPEGESFLKNNEALPMHINLGVGIEL